MFILILKMDNIQKEENQTPLKQNNIKPKTKNQKIIQKEKCPKCSKEIEKNKLKDHLQSSHITEVFNKVFIGSYANAKDKEELEKNNIKYILNCASECSNLFEDKIKYLKLDIKDQNDFPINEYFDKGANFINESLNNNDGNILVHCMQGKSRSTCLVMAYLIKYKKEDTNSAYKILKAKRKLTILTLRL